MAFSAGLGKAGFAPKRVHTKATVNFEKTDAGFAVTRIDLETEGEVPGIEDAAFQQQAEEAKRNCPISRLLAPGTQITLKARLVR
jgi:lipoyl-dependent peroxiredoxin